MDMVKVLNVNPELDFRKPRASWAMTRPCPSQPGRALDHLPKTAWPLAALAGHVGMTEATLQPGRPCGFLRVVGSKQQTPTTVRFRDSLDGKPGPEDHSTGLKQAWKTGRK